MQIVIDIPNRLKEIADEYSKIDNKNLNELTYYRMNERLALFCISKGTPLPKGHGRLIDADHLREDFKASKKISFAERMDISCIVDHAPIIIEADREE